jgi:3-oxoacyl-[acyl-carrier-protein] synthase II
MIKHDVVVTGIGAASPLGMAAAQHFAALYAGRSAVQRCSSPDYASLPAFSEARAARLDRRDAIQERILRKLLTEHACLSVVAAGDALRAAGLQSKSEVLREAALYMGSLFLEVDVNAFAEALKASEDAYGRFDIEQFANRGMRAMDPLFLVKSLPNGGIGGVAIEHQILGPNLNIVNGSVSGLQATILGCQAIERGETDVAVIGAYDSLCVMDTAVEHLLSGRVCHEGCHPFTEHSDGYPLGEGAAFLVLESHSSARARGAEILAVVRGWGEATETLSLRGGPSGSVAGADSIIVAAKQSLQMAAQSELRAGGLHAVDVVFGDGLGTREDDSRELRAMQTLFGDGAVAFAGATSAIGHTGAASGMFNLIHSVVALWRQEIPPTLSDGPRMLHAPAISGKSRKQLIRTALAWCCDRGIRSASLVLDRHVD